MTKLTDYRDQVKEELDNEEIPDCKILIAFEINCLTDALYKLIDELSEPKEIKERLVTKKL